MNPVLPIKDNLKNKIYKLKWKTIEKVHKQKTVFPLITHCPFKQVALEHAPIWLLAKNTKNSKIL